MNNGPGHSQRNFKYIKTGENRNFLKKQWSEMDFNVYLRAAVKSQKDVLFRLSTTGEDEYPFQVPKLWVNESSTELIAPWRTQTIIKIYIDTTMGHNRAVNIQCFTKNCKQSAKNRPLKKDILVRTLYCTSSCSPIACISSASRAPFISCSQSVVRTPVSRAETLFFLATWVQWGYVWHWLIAPCWQQREFDAVIKRNLVRLNSTDNSNL